VGLRRHRLNEVLCLVWCLLPQLTSSPKIVKYLMSCFVPLAADLRERVWKQRDRARYIHSNVSQRQRAERRTGDVSRQLWAVRCGYYQVLGVCSVCRARVRRGHKAIHLPQGARASALNGVPSQPTVAAGNKVRVAASVKMHTNHCV